jgi:thymidylate kinase
MIIAVEGLDGSGKTTVARALATMLDASYLALPPPPMQLVTAAVLRRHDSLARYLYYLSSAASLAEAAQGANLIVADRYISSAHALHVHVLGEIADSLRRLKFPCADLTIYLEVSEPERRDRLTRRGVPLDPFEVRLNDDDAFRAEVAQRLQGCPGTYRIDTSGMQPQGVAELARSAWRQHLTGSMMGQETRE